MNLRQTRLERGLKQCEVVDMLKAVDSRMTVPIYSVIETGLVEPNEAIAKELRRIFPDKASSRPNKTKEPVGITSSYKLTVRIPFGLMEAFMQTLGENRNITQWVRESMERTISENS